MSLGCKGDAFWIPNDDGCNNPAIRLHSDLIKDLLVMDVSPKSNPTGSQPSLCCGKHKIRHRKPTVHIKEMNTLGPTIRTKHGAL